MDPYPIPTLSPYPVTTSVPSDTALPLATSVVEGSEALVVSIRQEDPVMPMPSGAPFAFSALFLMLALWIWIMAKGTKKK